MIVAENLTKRFDNETLALDAINFSIKEGEVYCLLGASGAGKTLSELGMQEQAGVTIFAMREAETLRHVFNPPPDRILNEGDVLIGCADPDQLETARRVAGSGSQPENSVEPSL